MTEPAVRQDAPSAEPSMLLLGFPPSSVQAVVEHCAAVGSRYRPLGRQQATAQELERARYDVVVLDLAHSGLEELAHLMRLCGRCASVVVTGQRERELGWLRLINVVLPQEGFTPERLIAAADEALLRRRHHYAGVVVADSLQALRSVVGDPGGEREPGVVILDAHHNVVFASPTAKALGPLTLRRVVEHWRHHGQASLSAAELRLDASEHLAHPLDISSLALDEHGQSLTILRIQQAGSGAPMESLLKHVAQLDGQTGLPNRNHFERQLERAIADAGGASDLMALLFIQLETAPDERGEPGEEATLRVRHMAAERLQDHLRGRDLIARLGGNTYAVLLRGDSRIEDLSRLTHKLLASLSHPYITGRIRLRLVPHIGVALFPDDGATARELMHRADRALARLRGRAVPAIEFFQPQVGSRAQRRWLLESRLPAALAQRNFRVHFQPVVDSARRVVGAEALARWRDPELGEIPPDEFIPLIEELRLMNELSEQVYTRSFAQLRRWRETDSPDLTLSVNVSPTEFLWPGFIGNLERQIRDAEIPPESVELEITEALLIEDHHLTRMVLADAQQLGVRVFLDDFGTGYSSLGYLVDLPVTGIKVDRTFCSGLPDSRTHVAMTATILTLARHLGLDVLVEGVETEPQAVFLTGQGVPRLQGFLFSPAVKADDFARLMKSLGIGRFH